MKLLRKLLILAHRYLGIALSLMVVMWFATGITMMYAGGMPRLAPQLRLERLAPVDLSNVRLAPADAVAQLGGPDAAGRVTLLSVMGRPAYRIGADTVFADSGELLDELTLPQSRTVASRFLDVPENRVHHVRTLHEIDQWTLGQSRQMPLHKFRVDDEDGTELYVAPRTGEVAMVTTRRNRALAWVSTIPHWLYFTALRENQPVWYRIVVWTAALTCVLAVLGLALGITQFRRSRPFRLSASLPYTGWMRWHYVSGVIFGVFTLTWAFSGLLSMEPFAWTNARGLEVRREVFTGGPIDLSRFGAMDPQAWDRLLEGRAIKEIELARIHDEHYYVVRHAMAPREAGKRERLHQPYYVTGRVEPERALVAAGTLEMRREPFSVASMLGRLERAFPGERIADHELLADYDSYYYSRGRQTPLPVLRVRFEDPARTWVYIDPETSQVLAQVHRWSRVERWLYNGLHSLDFSFWYNRRPLWDVGMIVLLLGGLVSSGAGLLLGIRRLRRGSRRLTQAAGTEAATIARGSRAASL